MSSRSATAVALAVVLPGLTAHAAPPNVVLVMADDLGWGDVGFNGNTTIHTPKLDALAAAGCRLDRFYAGAPVCSPTRASCLTGRNGQRLGIDHANVGHIAPREVTLAEVLRAHGYRTGHFGKWHLGTLTRLVDDSNRGGPGNAAHYAPPWEHGFEACFATEARIPTWDPMRMPPGGAKKRAWAPLAADDPAAEPFGTRYWTGPEQAETTNLEGDDSRVIMDRALEFIDAVGDGPRPFFTVIWLHAPHLPVVAGERYHAMYEGHSLYERSYYGCVTALDEQVGRLHAFLRDRGLLDRTMLWFCADNGPEGRAGRAPGTAGPFRGRKRDLYEGGIRVPAFVLWPGRVAPGSASAFPMVTSDFLPTILAAASIPPPDDRLLDGIDVSGALAGDEVERASPIGFAIRKAAAWMTHRHKLITNDAGETWELYDLLDDPAETTDLAAERPEVVQQMKTGLETWRSSW